MVEYCCHRNNPEEGTPSFVWISTQSPLQGELSAMMPKCRSKCESCNFACVWKFNCPLTVSVGRVLLGPVGSLKCSSGRGEAPSTMWVELLVVELLVVVE